VLITDSSSYKTIAIARFLKESYEDTRVVSTSPSARFKVVRSRYFDDVAIIHSHPHQIDNYVSELESIISSCSAEIAIPVNSEEIRAVMARREKLGPPFGYLGTLQNYQILDNKKLFFDAVRQLNLPHPKVFDSLDASLPLIIKPRIGSSSGGVMYIHDEQTRTAARQKLFTQPDEFLIQEFVQGEGVGFEGYVHDGQMVKRFAHRRLIEYPVSGGSSVLRETYPYGDVELMESFCIQILEIVPWSGFVMFEFKRSQDGEIRIIECNPRVWGSIHQGLNSGVNFFAPLLGEAIISPADRTRTELFPLSFIAAVTAVPRGNWHVIRKYLTNFRKSRHDISVLADPLGFISLMWQYL